MTFRPIKRLATHDEATQTARALAARIAPTNSERDRERRLPAEEIADLAATGLLAITVPKAYGGPDLSAVTLAETTAILAEADASIGQIPQNHFYLLEALRWDGSEAQKHFYFSRALAGEKFFNALSESATPHAHVGFTRLVREGEGLRIQGRKAYSTGVLLADWIGIAAKDDEDRTHLCFVDASRAGVTRIDDWASFGQRTTASGTTNSRKCRGVAGRSNSAFSQLRATNHPRLCRPDRARGRRSRHCARSSSRHDRIRAQSRAPLA